MYVWAVRRRNEEVAPPSYLEVSKPPSYSSCHPLNRGQSSDMDIVINRESWHINHYSYRCHQPEPGKCDRDWAARIQRPLQPRQQPAGQAGGEWYERGGGVWLMWGREQICDGVGTLIHSATMSDVNLDILDWNLQIQQARVNSNSGSVSQAEQTGDPELEPGTAREERRASAVLASRSMFTIITTPRRKGGSWHFNSAVTTFVLIDWLMLLSFQLIHFNPIGREE